MIRSLSETVIVPIAGLVLAFVMTLEFIQMIIERNNLHDFDISNIYKWMFKTACAVLIVTNTMDKNIFSKYYNFRKDILLKNSKKCAIIYEVGIWKRQDEIVFFLTVITTFDPVNGDLIDELENNGMYF